jgi:hypothetical protein
MSGGHFNDNGYEYYKVYQFADELQEEILVNGKPEGRYAESWFPNHSEEVIEYLKTQVPHLRKMSEIMRAIDYLYSGDLGDDSFMKRITEIERIK